MLGGTDDNNPLNEATLCYDHLRKKNIANHRKAFTKKRRAEQKNNPEYSSKYEKSGQEILTQFKEASLCSSGWWWRGAD